MSKDLEDSENFKQSIRRLEREMDGLLGELAQQAAEMQAVEVDLEKLEGEKATLLESFNGNIFCISILKRKKQYLLCPFLLTFLVYSFKLIFTRISNSFQ